MTGEQLSPSAQLMRFIVGKWISKPIYVAAELGLADMLADGPRSVEELARMSRTQPASLYRVMRALASVGIFAENRDGRFELTPMAAALQSGALRDAALMFNARWNDQAWTCLLDGVKTDAVPFERAHGLPFADWLARNPREAELLHRANAAKAVRSHRAVLEVYDFRGISVLTDVGGGYGALLLEVLAAHRSLRGIVADLPAALPGAKKAVADGGFSDRCRVVKCDFFKEVPGGSDAYLLSHILHDWPDERCRVILSNCRRAMKPGAMLLIVEMIVPGANEPSVAKLLDLEMLVLSGGRERTEPEFRQLLESAGLAVCGIFPTRESVSLIECRQQPA